MTPKAYDSIDAYLDFIAIEQQAPLNAQRWLKKVLRAVITLRSFPHRCQLAPENQFRTYEIRMLRVNRCIFLYTIDEHERVVRVFGFRHASQLPRPDELPENPHG